MPRDLLIGLDIGTTGCKVVAVDVAGTVVASSADGGVSHGYPLHTPLPDRAEQRIDEIWPAVAAALKAVTTKIDVARVAAIGLSGAMHSVMPVRDDGTPLAPAMTWADNRAIREASQLRQCVDLPALYQRTGCPLQWQYHAAKLTWLRQHAPGDFAQAQCFAAIKDWIVHRLTGRWATDLCIASSTGLLDIHRRAWDAESLALAGVDASRLPALLEPDEVVGQVTSDAADETGLPHDLPVYPGGSDGGMAIIGAHADEPGHVVMTVGTSGAVRLTTRQPRLDARQRTWCYVLSRAAVGNFDSFAQGGSAPLTPALSPADGGEGVGRAGCTR